MQPTLVGGNRCCWRDSAIRDGQTDHGTAGLTVRHIGAVAAGDVVDIATVCHIAHRRLFMVHRRVIMAFLLYVHRHLCHLLHVHAAIRNPVCRGKRQAAALQHYAENKDDRQTVAAF